MWVYYLVNLGMGGGGGAATTSTSLLAAIQAWWLSSSSAQALAIDGKLWYKERPVTPNDQLPYITYFLVSEPVNVWTTGYPQYDATIQINVHDSTAEAAQTGADALVALLSKSVGNPAGAPLVINLSPVMHVLQNDYMLTKGEGLGPGGQDCWVAAVTFDIPWTP